MMSEREQRETIMRLEMHLRELDILTNPPVIVAMPTPNPHWAAWEEFDNPADRFPIKNAVDWNKFWASAGISSVQQGSGGSASGPDPN